MCRRFGMTVVMVSFSCLLAACGGGNAPEKNPPEPPPANRADLTLYVEGMTERQGIT